MVNIPEIRYPYDRHRVMACLCYDLREFCQPLGIDIDFVTRPLSIDRGKFQDYSATIGFNQICRLFEALASMAGDDCFGLRYALFYKRGAIGPFGHGLATAKNFREMLKFLAKYTPVLGNMATFRLFTGDETCSIKWQVSRGAARNIQYQEFALASALSIAKKYTQGMSLLTSAKFERRPPRDLSLHSRLFCEDLSFESDYNEIVFSSSLMENENPYSDEVAHNYMVRRCESILEIHSRRRDIVTALRDDFLANMNGGDCTIKTVALRQGMSERTLQRRLEKVGTGFLKVFEDARDEYSMKLLANQDLTLSQIATMLGYSSQSAYTRAVSRRHNKSPRRLREGLTAK